MSALGWFVRTGHGHTAQFQNFQECSPPDDHRTNVWSAMTYEPSSDLLARLPFVPDWFQRRRHLIHKVYQQLGARRDWDAVILAGRQIEFLWIMARYRTYLYEDGTLFHGLPAIRAARLRSRREWAWWSFWLAKQTLYYRASRGIFAMSRWAASGFVSQFGLPAERVHVALPGANLKRWSFVDRSDRPIDAPVRILMVGGEFRRKGGEQLLEWAAQAPPGNWELHIVCWPGQLPSWVSARLGNPGPDERVSATLAPRLPRVWVHCGVRANSDELIGLYRDADIFCLPTFSDASSIASLEAMASGLPVIVSATGGIPELIRDGETGFLIPVGDAAALHEALSILIAERSTRLEMGHAARESYESYFNVERQLREMLAVIDRERPR